MGTKGGGVFRTLCEVTADSCEEAWPVTEGLIEGYGQWEWSAV